MNPRQILILGGPKTGKTHYGAQLLFRLEKGTSGLRFFDHPENIEPFYEAMRSLSQGRAAAHTPTTTAQEVVLPVEFGDGSRTQLVWPEYGGEQVSQLLSTRQASPLWKRRATESHAWLILVRHDLFRDARDLLNRPVEDWLRERQNPGKVEVSWMPQAQLVEVLQMLLFLRRSGTTEPLREPRLAVAVSCWDDLVGRERFSNPSEALREIAPLVASFVETNWEPDASFVLGLSSLGKTLSQSEDDAEFVDSGPQRQGFIVLPDGQSISDITWPLVELLKS